MGKANHSSSSSIDSSKHPTISSASSSSLCHQPKSSIASRDLSTDLRLGLTLSRSTSLFPGTFSNSDSREQASDWPPLKPLLRSTLGDQKGKNRERRPSFFVKVYMEGVPIGRKLDLFAHHGYDGLITTLAHMFKTSILYPDRDRVHSESDQYHVLTYEDKEGDWMMVGDVPWEMFVTTVKRLEITRANRC
ncbi:auxin-responsive protein IAA31 [Telopea speciosissima]|uniref:auxin-responsive protein IAA31 n=1 Tax=Telopea speciosissima TaxID=54955 RepID=UPI001CC7E014|nr:auxin-responsive protein IAA31 [Telopea speciosissima]